VPIIHPRWSGGISILVEGAAEPVPSADIEARDPLRIGNRFGNGLDPGILDYGVEQAGEPSVSVPDQETCPAPGILKIRNEVPRGLPTQDAVG
jgi:hypothetical protein